MQRSNLIRWAALSLPGLITLILTVGCGHHTSSAVPAPAPVTTAAVPPAAPPAAFQPYTLLPPPPPAPPVAVPRHRVLHLTRVHNRVYLADSDRHLYEAGRDPKGHVYPIYRDPATRVTYPLYYDPSRDNLYRLARQEDGHFYRNYVGQPDDQFYDTDRDYERITPSDADRPIVTDSYNTYNYNTYNNGPNAGRRYPYYAVYRPPPTHHASHFNDNWLWGIPVIIGVYLLLQPHHHSPPHPYYGRPNQVAVNQITRINIVNQVTQAAPVGYRAFSSPRPVYVLYPAGYSPQHGYPRYARPDVRPHGPIGAVAAVRAAALARPTEHPSLPSPNARPASFTPRPTPLVAAPRPSAPVHPLLRPRVQQARLAAPISRPTR
ncbi:MAG: hypothetical protein M3Y13_01145, partial [Armatimonadota bacterium]|nr:hypothetical protein [Armatimonadota bacterium]